MDKQGRHPAISYEVLLFISNEATDHATHSQKPKYLKTILQRQYDVENARSSYDEKLKNCSTFALPWQKYHKWIGIHILLEEHEHSPND